MVAPAAFAKGMPAVYTTPGRPQHGGVRLGVRPRTWLVLCLVWQSTGAASQPSTDVPASNRADLNDPPPRPPADDAAQKAKLLFDAIVSDAPERAESVFFPRAAFLRVKDMRDPGRYYDRLKRRFEQDIHALHAALPDPANARFERFELAKRGGFVRVREEANLLPYWASRHSFIHYRVGDQALRLEVRVMITWDDRWYVIHLNEFH